MISVVIPTYKATEALDLCLKSLTTGQKNKNQIIVVVDGFYDLNKDVLEKYSNYIDVLNMEQNVGTCRATNLGVYNCYHDKVLVINDDNVAPKNWDELLENSYEPNSVITPNEIEPYESMFRQKVITDLGRDPKTFDLDKFWDYAAFVSKNTKKEDGSTFPFLMSKIDYLKVGGFDDTYPSPSGFVADWEFFMKCKMNGMKMMRDYSCHFYHFVSVSAKSPENIQKSKEYEMACHEYFRYKWGTYAKHDPIDNAKYL